MDDHQGNGRQRGEDEMGAWINTPPHFFWAHIHVGIVWVVAGLFGFLMKRPEILLLAAAWHGVSVYLYSNNRTFEEILIYVFNRLRGHVYAIRTDVDRWKAEETTEKISPMERFLAVVGFGKK